jgi:regulator of protease activity HflC (stomatin/prohibitin superfamily)
MVRVGLRIIAMDIPPQDVITRDNVSVKVNAVLYFKVRDPSRAVLEIEDYLFATSQLAQTTLRSVIGQAELDELLAEREKFNRILQKMIDEGTDAWGIDVTAVEVKDIDLPQEMKRAMAKQAEAAGPVTDLLATVLAEPDNHQARYDLALALHASGKVEAAVEELLELFRRDREWNDAAAKAQLFKIFDSLKPQDPIVLKGRRKLSSMIFA